MSDSGLRTPRIYSWEYVSDLLTVSKIGHFYYPNLGMARGNDRDPAYCNGIAKPRQSFPLCQDTFPVECGLAEHVHQDNCHEQTR